MTSDGIAVLQWLFQNIWRFFTEWKIPGTASTPAGWFIFLILSGILLSFIAKFLGQSWFGGK